MKNTILLIFSTLLSLSAFSQDVIMKKNGDKIEAKVVEITSTTIKYRSFEQPEGPIRNIYISDVNEIIYEDGQWDKFEDKAAPTEKPVQSEKPVYSKPDRDHLFGNGFYLEGIICYANGIQDYEQYEFIGYDQYGYEMYGYTTVSTLRDYIGLNVRLGHKWYFGHNEKWRPGLQATWARIGVFVPVELGDYPPRFTLSLLNVGFANIIKFNDLNGIEINANVGYTVNGLPLPGLSQNSLNKIHGGVIFGAEIKYRRDAFAVGIDYSRIELAPGLSAGRSMNVIGATVGFKM